MNLAILVFILIVLYVVVQLVCKLECLKPLRDLLERVFSNL